MKKLHQLLAGIALTFVISACASSLSQPPTDIIFDQPQDEITSDIRLDSVDNEWDGYGEAVDVLGDVMVIGASEWNQIGSGSVYVYRRINNAWQLEANLSASDRDNGHEGQRFGTAVALEQNLLAIGAPGYGAKEGQANNGAVYLYQYQDQSWRKTARLTPDNIAGDASLGSPNEFNFSRQPPQIFGSYLALNGRTLAVGGDDERLIYIFQQADDNTWHFQTQLTIPEIPDRQTYLTGLSLYGDTLALSALLVPPQPKRSPTTTGSVIVHIYERNDDIWQESDPFLPDDGQDLVFFGDVNRDVNIGASISLSGESGTADLLAVGLPGFPDWSLADEEMAQAFYGFAAQNPDHPLSPRQTGAVYLLQRTRSGWTHQATIKPAGWETPPGPGSFPTDLLAEDGSLNVAYVNTLSFPGHALSENPDATFFGATVDLDGRQLAVTAGFANATYLFQGQDQNWVYRYSFKPSPIKVEAWEDYAQVAAISGSTLLLGTPGEFGNSAYVFDLALFGAGP
jgi:hypothetical protein